MKKILLAAALAALLGGCASAPGPLPVIWHQGSYVMTLAMCRKVMHNEYANWAGCSQWSYDGFHIWSQRNDDEVYAHEYRHFVEGAFHPEVGPSLLASGTFGLGHTSH